MADKSDQRLYRIIDANFNRAREGLRVCEDVCRFVYDQRARTGRYKRIRHRLTDILKRWDIDRMVAARQTSRDVGRASEPSELKRRHLRDIFMANSQRVKESVRVLEELAKLIDVKSARDLKSLRYRVYILEQEVFRGFSRS